MTLFDPAAHESLEGGEWSDKAALSAIQSIADEAVTAGGPNGFWPVHPLDESDDLPADPTTLYLGASGVIWGLWSLAATAHAEVALDLAAMSQGALIRYRERPDFEESASLLMGETGVALVAHQLTGEEELVERLLELVRQNAASETNELMWGAPGTMLAAHTMVERTGDGRFAEAWYDGAERLWALWGEESLWTQSLFGRLARILGPVHGFAGNVRVLVQGGGFLEAIKTRTATALEATAVREDGLANWPPRAGGPLDEGETIRTQWCHGAPGIVATLWDVAPEELLLAGGELTWKAGPLAKGPGLCHGTAGNGYAFLKLFELTGDEAWLERARAFGMHAIAQVERAREEYGRGRFTLWTGDVGVALYLRSCLDASAEVPTIDAW